MMSESTPSHWSGLKVLVLSPTPTHPVDFGNRRRVFQVCRRIKSLGAEIHFVHYPAEADWRHRLPAFDQRAMQAAWDAYYVCPVTRPLHADAVGADHGVDEWWDPSIADFLAWIFSVERFDAFIVNYVWLSKAFDYAPPGTLRILDTHDKLTGRRQLLARHGIAPQFFHLTADEERTGVDRADIVWAIKPQEEEHFRAIAGKPVLTLPHAEPVRAPAPGGARTVPAVIRFGILGARNSINAANIRAFLRVVDAFIRRTLLPCEIIVAGTICEAFEGERHAGVRFAGRVADIESFYDSIDVALVPMAFSTGLKIRVAEALAQGKPVIAHRHAFEGFVPAHAFHRLPSFEAMLGACREVVAGPQMIGELAQASLVSAAAADRQVAEALEATWARRQVLPKSFCFVVPLSALARPSLVLDHVVEAAEYVGHQCPVLFFLDGTNIGDRDPDGGNFDSADFVASAAAAIGRMRRFGPVVLSPDAADAMGPRIAELMRSARPLRRDFDSLMSEGHFGFWFAHLPPRLARCAATAAVAVVPVGLLAQAHMPRSVDLRALSGRFAATYLCDYEPSQALAAQGGAAAATWQIPVLWRGHASEVLGTLRGGSRSAVVVFADADTCPLAALVVEIIAAQSRGAIQLVCAQAGATARPSPRVSVWRAGDWLRAVAASGETPYLAVDIACADGFSPLREVVGRARVPLLRLFDSAAADMRMRRINRGRVAGLLESTLRLCDVLACGKAIPENIIPPPPRLSNDAGWTMIWDLVGKLKREHAAA
jgi:glycosyltransferase involved in cell wall biosynthesis